MSKIKITSITLSILAVIAIIIVSIAIFSKPSSAPKDQDSVQQNSSNECRTHHEQQYCAKDYLGLSEAEATAKARQISVASRVVERESEKLTITEDYSDQRLNFTIKDGKVSKVEFY